MKSPVEHGKEIGHEITGQGYAAYAQVTKKANDRDGIEERQT